MKLAIYHNVIAPYKVPFFEAICNHWPGEVRLFTSSNLRNSRGEWGEQQISAENLQVTRLPAIRGPGIGWYNPTVFLRLLRTDFDILLTGDYHFISSVLVTWAAKVRKKPVVLYTVATERSVICNPDKSWFHKHLNALLQYGTGRAPTIYRTVQKYDSYITPSEHSINHLTEMDVDKEKIVKIYNPVDTNKFSPETEKRYESGKKALESEYTLCYVGRLVPEKGLQYLIESLTLSERKPGLLLVGDGPFKGELQEMVSEYGLGDRVEIVGRVPHSEVPAIHEVSDAFVLPSVPTEGNVEQFPNALLEAMSSGLPAITFDIGGGIEEIHVDGQTGVKARSITAQCLAESIDQLFEMDFNILGVNARKRIVTDFSPDSIGRQYVTELTKTANEFRETEGKMN